MFEERMDNLEKPIREIKRGEDKEDNKKRQEHGEMKEKERN